MAQLTTVADDNNGEETAGGGSSSKRKTKAKPKKTGEEDVVKKKRKGGAKKGKTPASQREKESDSGGASGDGTSPFALRSAIASPPRHHSSALASSSSDDENRDELNAPLGYYQQEDSPRYVTDRLAEASTVAFVHEEKSAALEGEIRRLQQDVVHHRASEANLRAALDATTEAWKRESSISGAGNDEIHERLAASFDAQAHLQEALSREVNSRRLAEEENSAARKECASMRDELERVKRDLNEGLLAASRERDELMETLHRESTARQAAEEACKEARLQLTSMEAQLVKQSEEMLGLSARAQDHSDSLRSELKSARLEATQARARVEETLSALAGAKEAELEARKSETNAVGYSSLLSTQLQALRDELDLTSEQQATFSAMINSNLRNANEELQKRTTEKAHQENLLFQAKAECVEARAECSSLKQKLTETVTTAKSEIDEVRSALQASERRAAVAEKMLHTLSRAAVGPSLQPTEGDGTSGSVTPNRAREALELLGSMSTSVDFEKSSIEIAALDAAAAEVDMLQGMLTEESRKRQEGEAEAKYLANRLRELSGEEPSEYMPEASLEAQILEAKEVRSRLEEQLTKAERDNSDLRRRVEVLDTKCREMALKAPAAQGGESTSSAELAEALQSRDMADAQASMLRSCLEDTEEMLEESRSALRDMEQKVKSIQAVQQRQGSEAAPEDKSLERPQAQADDAKTNATAAISRAEAAESKLSAMEARLQEAEALRSNMLIEHQEAISAFEASLKEAEEAGNAMVAEHQQEKYAYDVKLKELEIKHDAALTEHQEVISAYEENLKEEEAARRVANSEVERLQAAAHEYDANLESLREALREAMEKNTVSQDMLQHVEHANHELQEQLAESRGDMNSLRDELHQAQKDRYTIEETLNGSMHDIGEALAQKEDVMNQLDETQDRLSLAEKKLANIESAKETAVADAETARVAAKEALEKAQHALAGVEDAEARAEDAKARAEDAEARVEDAEARMELLREDLAAATADSQDVKEEVESLHLRLAHAESQLKSDQKEAELSDHESWLTSTMEAAAREYSSVAVQTSDAGSSLPDEPARVSSDMVRALETRVQAEKDLNNRLKMDLDSAKLEVNQREAEAGELQATSDLQARRIDVLTTQLDALQMQVSTEPGVEQVVDVQKLSERLAEALSDANSFKANLTSESKARRIAENELARVQAELSTVENDRKEAEAKAQAADAMIASLISPEPGDEKLKETVSLLQEEVARLQSEQNQVDSRERQYVAEMQKIISQRDQEASKHAAAETLIAKLQAQLKIALEDNEKEAMLHDHANVRTELTAALEEKANQLAEEMSKLETAEAKYLAAEEEIERLTKSLQAATSAFDTEVSLQEEIAQLQAALATEKTKRDELETQFEAADSTSADKLMELEDSLENTRSELLEARQVSQRSLEELEATLQEEIAQLQAALTTEKTKRDELETQLEAADSTSADKLMELEDSLENTRSELLEARQVSQRSLAELEAMKSLMEEAQDKAQRSTEEVKATKKKLTDLQHVAQRSAAEAKAVKKQLDDAQAMAKGSAEEVKANKKKLADVQQAAQRSADEVKATKKKLETERGKACHNIPCK